jgi:histidyl-tRNA synthetase
LGAQDSLLGGGRYDDLAEMLGGPPTPAIGFAGGMERLILVLKERANALKDRERLDLFFVTLGQNGRGLALKVAKALRQQGISVDLDYRTRALRKQMSYADQLGARFLLVFGDDEVASKQGRLKEMDTGEEREVLLTPEGISAAINGR